MKSAYDIELIGELSREIKDEVVKIHQEFKPYFDKMESVYAIGLNGINWTKNGYIYYEDLSTLDEERKNEEIHRFLESIAGSYSEMLDEPVIVFGGNLIDLAYEMRFNVFIALQRHFFSIPQHTYVLFLRKNKCINFTFEDELFFG